MAASEDAIILLRSIDASLKALVALSQKRHAAAPKEVATAEDLDGQYGNPEVKQKDPRDWSGPSMKGRRFSECPAEYLDLLASRFDYFADKAEAANEMTQGDNPKPVAPYRRKDAARARGWAARIRAGKVAAAAPPVEHDLPVDDADWEAPTAGDIQF